MIGLKGIGGQAIRTALPRDPGPKVQIMMIIHVCNSCLQVWGIIGGYTHAVVKTNVIFIIIVIPTANCWKKQSLKSLYRNMCWYHCCELLCSRKRLGYRYTGPIQMSRNCRTGWRCCMCLIVNDIARYMPPCALNFAVKSGYGTTWLRKATFWGKMLAICISFIYSKAAL